VADGFFDFCRIVSNADVAAAVLGEYRARLEAAFGAELVKALADKTEAIVAAGGDVAAAVGAKIFGDAKLQPLAQQLVLLLFAGATFDAASNTWTFTSSQSYFSALMWEAVGAHIPALSGGYFGHWRYPAET
jgi:hypothetical protein